MTTVSILLSVSIFFIFLCFVLLILINRNVVIFKEIHKEVSKTNLKVIHTDIDNVHTILDEIYCAKGNKPRQTVKTTSNDSFNNELRNKFNGIRERNPLDL